MAKLVVNNFEVNGKLSFDRTINEARSGFIIQGVLSTHLYFEDIKEIETYRYKLSGITLFKESFGSDDYNIYYHFIADEVEIKGEEYGEGITSMLYPAEIIGIDNEMYKNDHSVLGDIGEEYKNISEEEEEGEKEE